MNIQQAKLIPIESLVRHLGGKFSRKGTANDTWWFSPFRPEEKTASFKIDERNNRWHDFGHVSTSKGQGSGGDILDLWCDYHNQDRRTGIASALQDLARFATLPEQTTNQTAKSFKQNALSQAKKVEVPARFKILKIHSRISMPSLKEELQRRRISLDLANRYLKQGYILDTETKKKYNGFLFENDKGGYEISMPNPIKGESFKTSTKPKGPTTIAGQKDATSADIFEGFWDFLSWLEMNKTITPKHHTYVLNSLSFVFQVVSKVIIRKKELYKVCLFLDNDISGVNATNEFALLLEPTGLLIADMHHIYKDDKDLSLFRSKNYNRN